MSDFSRRTLIRGAAWTTPVILAVGAAPAFATSLRKDPGINGWVRVTYDTGNPFTARFDSDPQGTDPATADGAPFGLYLYDVNVGPGNTVLDTITNASITMWFLSKVGSWSYDEGRNSTTPNSGGHGVGWSNPTYVGTENKPGGGTWHGYRFDYSGSFALGDGNTRVYLQDFSAQANNVPSSSASFWTQRKITVNGVVQSFQRRAGEAGNLTGRSVAGATQTFTAIV